MITSGCKKKERNKLTGMLSAVMNSLILRTTYPGIAWQHAMQNGQTAK